MHGQAWSNLFVIKAQNKLQIRGGGGGGGGNEEIISWCASHRQYAKVNMRKAKISLKHHSRLMDG